MKTTILGILTIIGVVVQAATLALQGHPVDLGLTLGGITAGLGLIHAADAPKAK